MTGSHITPKHPKDDSLDLSSLFVFSEHTCACVPTLKLYPHSTTLPKVCLLLSLLCVCFGMRVWASSSPWGLSDCEWLTADSCRIKTGRAETNPEVSSATGLEGHSVTRYGPERMRLGQPLSFWSSDGSGIKEVVMRGAVWVLVVLMLHETVVWPF